MFQKYLSEAAKTISQKKAQNLEKYGLRLDDIEIKVETLKQKKLKLQRKWAEYTNDLLDNVNIQNTCYVINKTQIEQTDDVIEPPQSLFKSIKQLKSGKVYEIL